MRPIIRLILLWWSSRGCDNVIGNLENALVNVKASAEMELKAKTCKAKKCYSLKKDLLSKQLPRGDGTPWILFTTFLSLLNSIIGIYDKVKNNWLRETITNSFGLKVYLRCCFVYSLLYKVWNRDDYKNKYSITGNLIWNFNLLRPLHFL